MSDFNFLTLHAQLAGFKLVVSANRFGCDTDFARRIHDGLLEKLDELIRIARQGLKSETCMRLNTDPVKADDLKQNFWMSHYDLERRGLSIHERAPLLDHLDVDPEDDTYFNTQTGRWGSLSLDRPTLRPVSDEDLEGVRGIIQQIAEETHVRFSVDRLHLLGQEIAEDDGDDIERRDEFYGDDDDDDDFGYGYIDGPEDEDAEDDPSGGSDVR